VLNIVDKGLFKFYVKAFNKSNFFLIISNYNILIKLVQFKSLLIAYNYTNIKLKKLS